MSRKAITKLKLHLSTQAKYLFKSLLHELLQYKIMNVQDTHCLSSSLRRDYIDISRLKAKRQVIRYLDYNSQVSNLFNLQRMQHKHLKKQQTQEEKADAESTLAKTMLKTRTFLRINTANIHTRSPIANRCYADTHQCLRQRKFGEREPSIGLLQRVYITKRFLSLCNRLAATGKLQHCPNQPITSSEKIFQPIRFVETSKLRKNNRLRSFLNNGGYLNCSNSCTETKQNLLGKTTRA